jgi:hypothetical protein
MASSVMLRRLALVLTDVSVEFSLSFISLTRIGELETTLDVTSNRLTLRRNTVFRLLVTASTVPSLPILVTLMKEALSSSETSALTRSTQRNITEDTILQELLNLIQSQNLRRTTKLCTRISELYIRTYSCSERKDFI